MTTPDPARLVQLLTDAGFQRTKSRPDGQSFEWPAWQEYPLPALLLAGHPDDEEAATLMAWTVSRLRDVADVGRRAQQVLDGLNPEETT